MAKREENILFIVSDNAERLDTPNERQGLNVFTCYFSMLLDVASHAEP
jgi:hypothetical protein